MPVHQILEGVAFVLIGAGYLVPPPSPLLQVGGACLLILGVLILFGA